MLIKVTIRATFSLITFTSMSYLLSYTFYRSVIAVTDPYLNISAQNTHLNIFAQEIKNLSAIRIAG